MPFSVVPSSPDGVACPSSPLLKQRPTGGGGSNSAATAAAIAYHGCTGSDIDSDDPSVMWKAKQRFIYRDEVAKCRNDTVANDEDINELSISRLSSEASTQRVEYRPLRDYSDISNTMSHPISPLARSQINLAVPTPEATAAAHAAARQALVPAHIPRNDSAYSLAVQQTYQISRRPSLLLQQILAKRPSVIFGVGDGDGDGGGGGGGGKKKKNLSSTNGTAYGSMATVHTPGGGPNSFHAKQSQVKNRRHANDAISAAVSAMYCKVLVLLGMCLPITEVLTDQIPTYIYQSFYVYLYVGSISFVVFLYISAYRGRTLFNALKDFHERNNNVHLKHKVMHFGSFYLRVGAIAFAIGTMVYSGLEFGQFFELNGQPGCRDAFVAITPICRMALCIVQVQFIFLNTTYLDMARHKVMARFGLMHMVATNLCEWLYVLVEETKHEIFHIHQHAEEAHGQHDAPANLPHVINEPTYLSINWTVLNSSVATAAAANTPIVSNEAATIIANLAANMSTIATSMNDGGDIMSIGNHITSGCSRTNIMGALVQTVAPFLFPCTIEYSLICAVILYEMWKAVKSIPDIDKTRKHSIKPTIQKSAHHFSVDCSQSHKGLFFGILIIVMTIISMIMYFVLFTQPGYAFIATQEVTLWETIMYALCATAIVIGIFMMRDLRFVQGTPDEHHSMELDNMLLVVAQTGVFLYSMFTILGSIFSSWDTVPDRVESIIAEVFNLAETALQTMFILHASHRRCKGSKQIRRKPGREIITFLLVANIAIWFVNTLIKGRAVFHGTHLIFYGVWGWTIITHISMPLAIFYRFHSTICLFEVWKVTYKAKAH